MPYSFLVPNTKPKYTIFFTHHYNIWPPHMSNEAVCLSLPTSTSSKNTSRHTYPLVSLFDFHLWPLAHHLQKKSLFFSPTSNPPTLPFILFSSLPHPPFFLHINSLLSPSLFHFGLHNHHTSCNKSHFFHSKLIYSHNECSHSQQHFTRLLSLSTK